MHCIQILIDKKRQQQKELFLKNEKTEKKLKKKYFDDSVKCYCLSKNPT